MKRARRTLALVQPEIPKPPTTMDEKRAAAIAYLGRKWRHHKDHDSKLIAGDVLGEWRKGRA